MTSKPTFIDDDGNKIKAVTAEQHALDNPEHIVVVWASAPPRHPFGNDAHTLLMQGCSSCTWWNEEGYR